MTLVCLWVFAALKLTAVDVDSGENGHVTYRILAGDQGQFLIGRRYGK